MNYFGSILSISNISPRNAHGWGLNLRKGSVLSRIIEIVGVPHTSARIRNRIVSKILKLRLSGRSIIDIGSGIGLTGFYLNQFGFRYLGVDKSRYKIELAKMLAKKSKRDDIEFLQSNILSKPKIKEKFDSALCMEVIEHVRSPELLISTIATYVKKGGLMVFSFPSTHYINSLSKRYFGHIRVGYEPSEIKKFCVGNTARLIKVYSFGNSFPVKIGFLIDFYLIKYLPLLAGVYFWFFYPLAIFDTDLFMSKNPLGYIVVLKK